MRSIIPLSAVLVFFLSVPLNAHAAGKNKQGFTYSIDGGHAVITGFDGSPENIDIPSVIDGCPVAEISENAFYCCKTLRHIELPDGLKKIGHHSFYGCSALESIDIPASVTDIGEGSFCGCISLTSITFPVLAETLPDSCFRSCTSLTRANIPDNIHTIESFCFSGCTSLQDISLSNQLSCIGSRAFFMCSSLEKIYIPPSVKKIGQQSLGYLPDINGAVIKDGFTILGEADSSAEKYADKNGLSFSDTFGAVPAFAVQKEVSSVPQKTPRKQLAGAFLFFIMTFIFFGLAHKKRNFNS